MSQIMKLIKSKSGTTFPLIVAVVLALLMIFTGISEYLRLMIIAGGVRDAAQQGIISVVNDNYADVYHSVREGYAAGYEPSGDGFEESINNGDVYAYLDDTLGLSIVDDEHEKTSGGDVEYKIYDLSVEIKNAPLAPTSTTQKFMADGYVTLEVPVRYGNKILPPMKIRLNIKAAYTEVF